MRGYCSMIGIVLMVTLAFLALAVAWGLFSLVFGMVL